MSSRLIEPITATSDERRRVCAICGRTLLGQYFFFPERPERYCSACMESRPRCATCGAPAGPDGWQLHDGRVQCARCRRTAVYDPAVANALYNDTIAALAEYPGLRLNVGAAFRMVDAPTLNSLGFSGGIVAGADQLMLGLFQREGRLRVVYALYGLPRLIFREVVAHEYTHAWQGEYCPLLRDPIWREGFAEWIAYLHLRHKGANKAAERLRGAKNPYALGLQQCIELEAQVGVAGVLDAMRRMQ